MRSAVVLSSRSWGRKVATKGVTLFLAEIDIRKIPGEMKDRVKLHTYLSPGDLLVLWNSFKIAGTLFSPEAAADTVRITNNLCGFWKTMLDKAREAVEAGEYPCEFVITFCRGDFFMVVLVMDRLLTASDWFTESAKKPMLELRRFFSERLYDPSLEQGTGSLYRQRESVMNNHYLGREILNNPEGIISPNPQRIILFGVVLGLLMPPERQPFSIRSISQLMADLFDWNPMRTLEETNRCLKLCAEDPHYNPDLSKDEFGLVHVRLPEALDFSPQSLDLKPLPTLRNIVAFAVAIALVVPDENRRRQLALQSMATLMRDLFGWSEELASEELNLCLEIWNEDGTKANFWTDVTGQVSVGVPTTRG
jgi:hypothetical protein